MISGERNCFRYRERGLHGPLDDVGSRVPAADIRAWLTDAKAMTAKTKAPRKPEMKAYTLQKAEVDALVAYLLTITKK